MRLRTTDSFLSPVSGTCFTHATIATLFHCKMRCPTPPTHCIFCNPDALSCRRFYNPCKVFTHPPERAPRLQISRLGRTPTIAYAVQLRLTPFHPPTPRPPSRPRASPPPFLPLQLIPGHADLWAAVPAGDVVLVEPALCWATLPDSWTTHCYECCRRLQKAVPCPSCASVSCRAYLPP